MRPVVDEPEGLVIKALPGENLSEDADYPLALIQRLEIHAANLSR